MSYLRKFIHYYRIGHSSEHVRATPVDGVNFTPIQSYWGWSKTIFIPKTQVAAAASLFSFPTRGSHDATSASSPLPQIWDLSALSSPLAWAARRSRPAPTLSARCVPLTPVPRPPGSEAASLPGCRSAAWTPPPDLAAVLQFQEPPPAAAPHHQLPEMAGDMQGEGVVSRGTPQMDPLRLLPACSTHQARCPLWLPSPTLAKA
jgi:hypothetical protein